MAVVPDGGDAWSLSHRAARSAPDSARLNDTVLRRTRSARFSPVTESERIAAPSVSISRMQITEVINAVPARRGRRNRGPRRSGVSCGLLRPALRGPPCDALRLIGIPISVVPQKDG